MERSLLEDFYLKHPNAKRMQDRKYPLDYNSERPNAILCTNDAGYNVPCVNLKIKDCQACWERNAKFDINGSFIKLVAPFCE